MKKTYKIICCHCGHMHKKSDLDEFLQRCHACNEPLSVADGWLSHAVRIFVEDADPAIIKHFIKEVKKKQPRQNSKKKVPRKKDRTPLQKKWPKKPLPKKPPFAIYTTTIIGHCYLYCRTA